MHHRIGKVKGKLRGALHTSGGRNFLLYLLFVAVAAAFWLMLSLDAEVQKDYEIPLQLTELSDSATVISDVPSMLAVNVKAKGVQLLRFSWGRVPVLKLDARNYITKDGRRIFISRGRLDARLREYFGSGVSIVSVKPDSISLAFTTAPGKRVKLRVITDIQPTLQCIISGPIRANVDSVRVFSTSAIPADLKYIETEPLVKTGLRDTTVFEVRIKPVNGLRIVPDRVRVTVPIEPLIAKKRQVQLDVKGVPAAEQVLTFPSKIEVNYLVPMSAFNDEYPIKAFVDYEDTHLPGDKVPVKLGALPDIYHNVSFAPDSVEYLIERNQR